MKLGLISMHSGFGNFYPPLGLYSIITYLGKYSGNEEIKLIDQNITPNIIKEIKKLSPDVIGISSMTISYGSAINLAKEIKENFDLPLIIGGVHISTLPESLSPYFDLAVIGEGEETVLELMKLYEKEGSFSKDKLKNIKGLAFLNNGNLELTPKRELIGPLDNIPITDKNLVDKKYFKPKWVFWNRKKGIEYSVFSSRGCPYNCVFCSSTVFWNRKIRYHSPEYVVREIQELVEKYKVDHISINDDFFTFNRERIKVISSMLKEAGILDKIYFRISSNTRVMDDELCKILKEMNIVTIDFGFESGSEKMLKYIKKGTTTVEDHRKAVLLMKKYGFMLNGSLILGTPGETIDDMKETMKFIDFIDKTDIPNDIWVFPMTPLPGTEMWEIAKKRNKVSNNMDWSNLIIDDYNRDAHLLDDTIDKEEFKKLFWKVEAKLNKMRMKGDVLKLKIKYDKMRLIKQAILQPKRALEFIKHIYM